MMTRQRSVFYVSRSVNSCQFRDRRSNLLQQGNGPAGRIANCATLRINPKMPVNRCEKITYSYAAVRGMFATPIGGANDMARRNAAAAEQEGHGVRPVIAPGLHDA
jgi:hypothetical protein